MEESLPKPVEWLTMGGEDVGMSEVATIRTGISSLTERAELLIRMFAKMIKHKVWRKRLRCEIESVRSGLEEIANGNEERARRLRQAQSEAEDRFILTLSKYDKEMKILHKKRKDLKTLRDLMNQNHTDIEMHLITQRVEYEKAKSEWASLVEKAIEESLEEFQRNRAARIIQRHWRACSCHVWSKRKRWRK